MTCRQGAASIAWILIDFSRSVVGGVVARRPQALHERPRCLGQNTLDVPSAGIQASAEMVGCAWVAAALGFRILGAAHGLKARIS